MFPALALEGLGRDVHAPREGGGETSGVAEAALQRYGGDARFARLQKRDRLDRLIALVDKTLKGERDMSFKQFDTTKIEEAKQQYAAEVKQRWGNTVAYAEYEKKSASYNTVQQKMLDGEGAAIFNEFGKNRSLPPDSAEVQELVKKWQAYITDNYYNCTKEILSCLGQMYVGDERLTQHIDQYGVGTAAFMAAAIEVYTS